MASEKNSKYSDSSSEDTTDRESEKFNDDDNTGMGRSYECNFCKRGFTNAQALGGHMNIHRKDKLKAKQESSSRKLTAQEANYAFDNSSYQYVDHDDLRPRHDNYYDANNLSLRIGPTLIDGDDDEEGGGKKDVDENEVDLELRLGYNHH
ncbi:hypothetical protein HAX54_016944 [Datura stramonium]|uniref:C2H2-type domain-containing protein n=1 Tax=Datura stramonium TaxID=4076 RepID=A0ABS8UL99_DATST|nr:hypothetical protein [Datura stramonium]